LRHQPAAPARVALAGAAGWEEKKTPINYPASKKFPIGGSKVVRQSGQDRVAVVAAGIDVAHIVKAVKSLLG
jgi:hypothetical protein